MNLGEGFALVEIRLGVRILSCYDGAIRAISNLDSE